MISVINPLMKAWYDLLNGNISVPVYRTNVILAEQGNHVLLRFESDAQQNVKSIYWSKPIIITEVVTVGINSNTDEVANSIDSEITQLYSSLAGNNLPEQDGIQIINVRKQGVFPVDESDGSTYQFRIITRYSHDIFHK